MIITEIKYGYTFNRGDFSSERIDLTGVLAEGDDATSALDILKAVVHGATIQPAVKTEAPVATDETPVKALLDILKEAVVHGVAIQPVVKTKAPVATDETPVKEMTEEAPKKRGRVKGTQKIGDKVLAPDEVKERIEENKVEAVVTEATKANPKFRTQGAVYNREMDLHKKLLGDLLNKEFPTWKTNVEKAKKASLALQGTEFLDGEGTMVESFKAKLRELMA